mmetsp:Transcript_14326/g.21653  ORF Transcript_14326/g.21653 Transcript_14326/m.21653 type:complete len:96 (-) Transcript_14326:11-298(-)
MSKIIAFSLLLTARKFSDIVSNAIDVFAHPSKPDRILVDPLKMCFETLVPLLASSNQNDIEELEHDASSLDLIMEKLDEEDGFVSRDHLHSLLLL